MRIRLANRMLWWHEAQPKGQPSPLAGRDALLIGSNVLEQIKKYVCSVTRVLTVVQPTHRQANEIRPF